MSTTVKLVAAALGGLVVAVGVLIAWAALMERHLSHVLSEEGAPWPPR